IPDLIIIPLAHIINMSFTTGKFPDLLKIVKVIPIHKGGSSQDVNNYRPISLLSIFDKIIEKLMHKRLYHYLEEHNILYQNQFGFRSNNSTVYALAQITEMIKESIDSGKYGCGIFIDLKKAFDTVNHDILLLKLEHYGIREELLEWFKSYLSGRRQFVSFNGQSSQLMDINYGVPQGSVLGPLLFLMYVNDLPNVSNILNFYLFADDTNIYYESKSLLALEKTINKELAKLYLWLNVNRLALNVEKTNYIIFHPYNKPIKQSITLLINKKAISEKGFIKYLGILLDSTLDWKAQILNISKKISRTLGIMYKLRPFLPLSVMKNIYYSLVYSHILYGIEVWGSARKTEMDKILILQKRALRLMTYNDQYPIIPGPLKPSNPIFSKLHLLKVDDIHKVQVSKFIFKSLNKLTPINFHQWFKFNHNIHSYQTRSNFNINNNLNSNNLFVKSVRTVNYGFKQLKVNGPRIWNALPVYIKTEKSLFVFLKKIKEYFILGYI
ncbi:MAG: reverse transcriptase family protein, partial [Nitrosopumilus sp.]